MWLTAEYTDESSVLRGVTSLLNAGFGSDAIEVFSPRPVELPPGFTHPPSRASLIAVLGAIINGSLATGFVYFAQHNYPLITGGMPLFSFWATGVITYELTMAGAVAGIVLAFLWESGLLRWRKPPAPAVEDGSSYVRIECSGEALQAASQSLAGTGAVKIEKLGDQR